MMEGDCMTYAAVGDIHGHATELAILMTRLAGAMNVGDDPVVFLGDYVDGGPDTRRVIESLRSAQAFNPHWVFLRGNHDQMLIDAIRHADDDPSIYDLWYYQGGKETLESYGGTIPEDVLDWLESLPLWHETASYIFVHAGIVPGKHPSECTDDELLWLRDSFFDSPYPWPKRVIYGHTYCKTPRMRDRTIGINTMHRGGGVLTAVLLDDARPGWQAFITDEQVQNDEAA
jgi:serine/threonine protein phosphatase 1